MDDNVIKFEVNLFCTQHNVFLLRWTHFYVHLALFPSPETLIRIYDEKWYYIVHLSLSVSSIGTFHWHFYVCEEKLATKSNFMLTYFECIWVFVHTSISQQSKSNDWFLLRFLPVMKLSWSMLQDRIYRTSPVLTHHLLAFHEKLTASKKPNLQFKVSIFITTPRYIIRSFFLFRATGFCEEQISRNSTFASVRTNQIFNLSYTFNELMIFHKVRIRTVARANQRAAHSLESFMKICLRYWLLLHSSLSSWKMLLVLQLLQ